MEKPRVEEKANETSAKKEWTPPTISDFDIKSETYGGPGASNLDAFGYS